MDKVMETFKERIKDKNFIITLCALGVLFIAVFLPIYEIDIYFGKVTFNYFSNNGELADGIFVIIGVIAALALLLFKKDKFAFIPVGIIAFLLIKLTLDMVDNDLFEYAVIGYYALMAGMIGSVVGLILLVKDEIKLPNNSTNKVVDAKFEEVKPAQANVSFCASCGTKNTDGSVFCPNCGNKF